MCIIVVKPIGKKLPTDGTLRQCWRNNPDGAGYMYRGNNGLIHIEKGFMSVDGLLKSLRELKESTDITLITVVIHFRTATHGEIAPGNTHPFPLSRHRPDLIATSIDTDIAIAHNGVISVDIVREKLSDTMTFIKTVSDNDVNTLLKALEGTGSKFAVAVGSLNRIHTVGYFHDNEGIQYSNTGFRDYTTEFKMWAPTQYDGGIWRYKKWEYQEDKQEEKDTRRKKHKKWEYHDEYTYCF